MSASSTPDRLSRTAVTALIFAICCLVSSVGLVIDTPNPVGLKVDDISKRSDQRFAVLKADLPPRGVVGYVGEAGNVGVEEYYLTQYALVPVVVEHSYNHAIVIGNFPSGPASGFPANLQLVKDFGDGVLLFANKDAQ